MWTRTKHSTLDIVAFCKILIPLFFSIGIFLWLFFDSRIPYWDEAYHLNRALGLSFLLNDIPNNIFAIYGKMRGYPPLYHLSAIPFFYIWPKLWFIRLANIIYLCIFSFAILKIGNRIPSKYAGIITLFVALCIPELSLRQRLFFLDGPVCSFSILALYLLIKADDFTDRKNAILYGISLGFGMLTKWTFLFFLVFPTCYQFIEIFRKRDNLRKQRIINYIFSLGIAFLISFPWYLVFRESIYKLLLVNTTTGFYAQGEHLYDLDSLSYYFKAFAANLTWPVLIATITGIFIVATQKKHPLKKILYCYLLPGLIALLFIENKHTRFSLPILSVLPLFGIISVFYIKRVKIRNVFIILILISSFTGYITSTFISCPIVNNFIFPTNITKQLFIMKQKSGERESILILFDAINNDSNFRDSKLFVAADSPPVEINALKHVLWMENVSHITMQYVVWRREEDYDDLIAEINKMDYIVTVTPSTGPWFAAKYINQIKEYIPSFIESGKIIKIGDFPIADKLIHLFRVKSNHIELKSQSNIFPARLKNKEHILSYDK